jgi:agmatinase
MDAFDPSIMSAVGTPEPGGILWHQALGLLRAVSQKKNIIGFDVVELCPDQGPASCAFFAAKLTYKLIGYAFEGHSS